ncbi:DUF5667 domain-containing protein [Nocardioides sp. CER19]|uniref:DUF5667 domain-containing protein n=1 Tax=Nocardioides sp. CER19 TaxID=3038538 RepID=UPI00244B27DB|nr:DUF5667 domain-containing protein [Nocardioides sp. CER19]MDH2414250.1 DUF5667 domain-containing protein [Nocardioides sp. CER19]
MSPAFPTRRRAEEFDALLAGDLTTAPSTELADLLAVVDQVRAVPEITPRAEFAASLRDRLMAEAPSALAQPATEESTSRLTVGRRTPSKTSHQRRVSVAIAAFSLVGATTASAFASQGALPGDTLYPVKRLIEDARTSLAMGDHAKADALLSQARTRLTETRELGTRDNPDTDAITQSLQSFSDAADHASTVILADYADHRDEQEIGQLRTFTQQGVADISELTDLLPTSVDGSLADALNTLIRIDHSAAQACPACDGAGITELPSNLVDLLSATTSGGNDRAPSAAATTAGQKPASKPKPSPTRAADASAAEQLANQLDHATGQLTGKGDKSPSSAPTSVGGVVGGAGGAVGGTVGGVGGAVGDAGTQLGGPVGGLLGTVGGVVGGLGDTVTGTTGALGDTLDGATGGLLGGASPTPTPKPKP